MTNTTEQTTYTVRVYVMTTWATGSPRGTAVRSFEITEDATILGGMRAIDAAVEKCNGKAMSDYSPEVTPNPVLEGWPLGEARS